MFLQLDILQFEAAEIILYGKDVTEISMCNYTECTEVKFPNCTMGRNTTTSVNATISGI